MPDHPLAYLITFTTYGAWLHGQAPGSVDAAHNQFDTPWIPPDSRQRNINRQKMSQEPYVLDEPRRNVVREAIIAECRFRGWNLLALHVRSNHVHAVIAATAAPEFVMRTCKAHASKQLNQAGFEHAERKRWTAHGSTKYLWDDAALVAAIEYTLDRQGTPMARFEGDWRELVGA